MILSQEITDIMGASESTNSGEKDIFDAIAELFDSDEPEASGDANKKEKYITIGGGEVTLADTLDLPMSSLRDPEGLTELVNKMHGGGLDITESEGDVVRVKPSRARYNEVQLPSGVVRPKLGGAPIVSSDHVSRRVPSATHRSIDRNRARVRANMIERRSRHTANHAAPVAKETTSKQFNQAPLATVAADDKAKHEGLPQLAFKSLVGGCPCITGMEPQEKGEAKSNTQAGGNPYKLHELGTIRPPRMSASGKPPIDIAGLILHHEEQDAALRMAGSILDEPGNIEDDESKMRMQTDESDEYEFEDEHDVYNKYGDERISEISHDYNADDDLHGHDFRGGANGAVEENGHLDDEDDEDVMLPEPIIERDEETLMSDTEDDESDEDEFITDSDAWAQQGGYYDDEVQLNTRGTFSDRPTNSGFYDSEKSDYLRTEHMNRRPRALRV